MANVLVRDVPLTVLKQYQAEADALKLSRNQLLVSRIVSGVPQHNVKPMEAAEWDQFVDDISDLSNAEIMSGAWR